MLDRDLELPAEFEPKDFRNTTLRVEDTRTRRAFMATVIEPKLALEGEDLTLIVYYGGEKDVVTPLRTIPYETFVYGGEVNGHMFPGILEEAHLKYSPPDRQSQLETTGF